MANYKGNHSQLKHFVKGDKRINRNGAPKRIPALNKLLAEILGAKDGEDILKSKLAGVVDALINEATSKRSSSQKVAAAKELLDRIFGKSKQVLEVKEEQPIIWNETKTYSK